MKPDLSKVKNRIKDESTQDSTPENTEAKPRISPQTAEQIQNYARDVEKMRQEEEDIENNRVALDPLPENVSPTQDLSLIHI